MLAAIVSVDARKNRIKIWPFAHLIVPLQTETKMTAHYEQ
jgi:hypothetical protein